MSGNMRPGDIRWLAQELHDLKAAQKRNTGKPQLAFSSIEDGAISGFDRDGVQTVEVGRQHDGTHTSVSLSGPKPPAPWFPSAKAVPGVVEVRWNGKFAGGLVSPMDFKHTAAYVVPVGSVVNLSDQAGVMTGELGDVVQVQVGAGVYDVYLAAWSLSGKVSGLAGPVSVVVPVPADADLIGDALEKLDTDLAAVQTSVDGKNSIRNETTDPTGDGVASGDRWQKWSTLADGGKLLASWRWDGTNWVAEAMDPTYLPLVDIGQGTFGELGGGRIRAKTIRTETLVVGSGVNLMPDPTLQSEAVRDLRTGGASGWDSYVTGENMALRYRGFPTSMGFRLAAIDYRGTGDSNWFPCNPGDQYRLKFRYYSTTGVSAKVFINFGSATGSPLDVAEAPLQAGVHTADFQFTVPGGVAMMAPGVYATGVASNFMTFYSDVMKFVQLSDAEVIVDGAITTDKLAANSVQAANVAAGAVDGQVITGAVIQSPGGGAGYQLTENGYTSRDADGNVTVRLPADGSTAQFRGDLEAKSLTASGRVSFQAPENEIASGAALVLESGVTAPASPPSVGTTYQERPLPVTGITDARNTVGLTYANGLWWRVGIVDDRAVMTGSNDAGAIVKTIATGLTGSNGITAIGNELFILGRWAGSSGPRHVAVYDATSGAYKRKWEYPYYGSGTYQPGIGTDGTDILVTQSDALGRARWRILNKTNGTLNSLVESEYLIKSNLVGIYKGPADFGNTRVAITRDTGATEVFKPDGTHYEDFSSWYSADKTPAVGLAWADGKFHHLLHGGRLVTYSGFSDGAGDTNDWWATQTWLGANGEETMASNAQRFTYMRRSELQVSGGEMPPGAVGSKLYLARKGTPANRADFHLLSEFAGPSGRVSVLPPNWKTMAAPPAANTFTNTDPGLIKSRIGGFEARGDGSGTWGPLTFKPDGTMTGKGTVASGTLEQPSVPANGGSIETVVTLPAGRFTTPPTIIAGGTNGRVTAIAGDVTASSFRLLSWNFTTSVANQNTVSWIAVEN